MAKRPRRPSSGGFNAFKVMDLLCSIPTLLPNQKLLLFVLLKYADRNGECWPSMRRLSTATSLNPITIQRLFPYLSKIGVLDVEPRLRPSEFGGVSTTSNLYRINLRVLSALTISPDKVLTEAFNKVLIDPVDNSDQIPVEKQ